MNLYGIHSFRRSLIFTLNRYSSLAEPANQILAPESSIVDEDLQAKQAELEEKRNKSGLTRAHLNVINDRVPYEEPKCLAHKTVKYHRKLYGKYGTASGVDPSLCWPTLKEIQETQEYEAVAYPFTIQQMMAQVAQKRKEEKEIIETREAQILAKLMKLGQWKKDLKNRIAKKINEANAAKEKKERLVEEVRRHFGFTLDPRDERFQEVLVKREKEQKKLDKQAKKDAKEKMLLDKLQQDSSAAPPSS